MIATEPFLVMLVQLVDRIPLPPPPPRRRGRPDYYAERLFLKALVVMIVRRLRTVYELLTVLEQPSPDIQRLRSLLTQAGQFPSRRTWERRLGRLPPRLPAQIGCLGRALVALIQRWAQTGRAVALDSTPLRAVGGLWQQQHRQQGIVPDSRIDTQAHWTKSGWHGWVYGWKLHIATTVAAVWIPLAAQLTPANVADNQVAPDLLRQLPPEARFVLGDRHYNAPNVRAFCEQTNRQLVAPRRGRARPPDAGVEVRRIFHALRWRTIENFHRHFKGIFEAHGPVPTKGLLRTQGWILGAVFVYQLSLWYRCEHGLDLRVGLKPFLKAA